MRWTTWLISPTWLLRPSLHLGAHRLLILAFQHDSFSLMSQCSINGVIPKMCFFCSFLIEKIDQFEEGPMIYHGSRLRGDVPLGRRWLGRVPQKCTWLCCHVLWAARWKKYALSWLCSQGPLLLSPVVYSIGSKDPFCTCQDMCVLLLARAVQVHPLIDIVSHWLVSYHCASTYAAARLPKVSAWWWREERERGVESTICQQKRVRDE